LNASSGSKNKNKNKDIQEEKLISKNQAIDE